MSGVNLIINNIKEEITGANPSSKRIISQLNDLKSKEEFQPLSDTEFYNIVGETFKLNPEFFMNSIYPKINTREMAKYIVEKFCLYDGEQILSEFEGDIKQIDDIRSNLRVSVKGGTIIVTNYRVIAQGKLKAKGGAKPEGFLFWTMGFWKSGSYERAKSKEGIGDHSLDQDIPCYGYQFKKKNLFGLGKTSNRVAYLIRKDEIQDMSGASSFKQRMMLAKATNIISIEPPIEQIDELYDHLFPKEDVNQIIERFRKVQDMGLSEKNKKKVFQSYSKSLEALWKLKNYQYLSDSEKMDIVLGVYKIDPELFISLIYPEMNNWEPLSFLNIKSVLFELLKKEGATVN
ncbi:MAG: hypothetical protein ACFFBW_10510 [Promethearchaeota archaeon]